MCVIDVEDTGQGIARDFIPHVFERFRQEDSGSTRQSSGLGLGLAIVRHIVDLHGGTIEAHSAGVGLGCTFTVRLPLDALPLATTQAAREVRHLAEEVPSSAFRCPPELRGRQVLVVDDEDDARDLLVSILTSCECVVRAARSAGEALEMLRQQPPDILVSDLAMPHVDGFSLIERIRALPPEQGGRTPAVALTACARSEDRAKALLAGFDTHAAKPIDAHHLTRLLASLKPAR